MAHSLLYKAMTYTYPESIPIGIGFLPACWKHFPKEMKALTAKYPQFFGSLSEDYDYEKYAPRTYRAGTHTDEWGCVWENIEDGIESIVKTFPWKDYTLEDLRKVEIPPDRNGRLPHGLMYLRILDLRGFDQAMIDFAEEDEAIDIIISKILEYNCYQIEAVVKNAGNTMYFGDDLGMQKGLAIGPRRWRKYMKPAFKKMYDIAHREGKYVYMHTDGMIYEIMDDLVEAGVNMINPQFRANGLDNLIRICKGRIPINLDLDRQLFPVATPKEIDDHVRECVEKLYLPEGGLGLSFEFAPDIPFENMDAAIKAAEKYRFYKT